MGFKLSIKDPCELHMSLVRAINLGSDVDQCKADMAYNNSIDVVQIALHNDYVSGQAENSGGYPITRTSLRYSEAETHFVISSPVYIKLRERNPKEVTLKAFISI